MKKIILSVTAAVLVCIILSIMAIRLIPASIETVATPDEPIATPDEPLATPDEVVVMMITEPVAESVTEPVTEPTEVIMVIETEPEETKPSEPKKETVKKDKSKKKDKNKNTSSTKEPVVETATPDTPSKDKNERVYLGKYKLTAYCPCHECSDGYKDNTSTGVKAKQGRTIAVDPRVIPYGSKIEINGKIYVAEDCGGAIKGKRIDVYFKSHKEANKFGIQYAKVYLVK
jgi:3D (Asp-Asp-Asp) domain-containing protein